MSVRRTVQWLAVFLVGILAGLVVGTGIEQHSLRALSASAWVTEHQVMDSWFRVIMPPFWNATVLLLAVAAMLSRGRARWMFGTAAILLLVSLLVTVRIEVPMNRRIATWNAAVPPSDWAFVRDRWLAFHRVRAIFSVTAFAVATLAFAQRTALQSLQKEE